MSIDLTVTRGLSPMPRTQLSEARLVKDRGSFSKKILVALAVSGKVIFFPLTIFAYLIYRSCVNSATFHGIGNKDDLKRIDDRKRGDLLALGGQEIRFGFEKDALLEGMFFQTDPFSDSQKTILVCAGSHRSYENYTIPMVQAFKSMGYNVLLFNYEGFGNSEGEASEEGVYRSVEAAYQYLRQEKHCEEDQIVAWGYSLGSGAVADLGLRHKVDLVIDRGFSSMSDIAYQVAPQGRKMIAKIVFMIGAYFDNLSKLKRCSGRLFIAQGLQDATMKVESQGAIFKKLVEESKNSSAYVEVESAHEHSADSVWFGSKGGQVLIQGFFTPSV